MIEWLLIALGLYLVVGVVYALYFVVAVVTRYDPVTGDSPHRIRFLILPGCVCLWPILLVQSIKRNPKPSRGGA